MTSEFTKAELWKLEKDQATEKFTVQFNPESLKVTFANQIQPPTQQAADDHAGTAATQYVGRGSTKLAVTLWFDVNGPLSKEMAANDAQRKDVRRLTEKVIKLMEPEAVAGKKNQWIPPAVRFLWGTFQFDGLIESIDQSLEFFSPEGIPLRASLTLSMTQQSIEYFYSKNQPGTAAPKNAGTLPSGAAAGASPLTAAPAGATVQGLATAAGKAANWQAIAEANGIENPRMLAPGQLIDLNVSAPSVQTPPGQASAFAFRSLG